MHAPPSGFWADHGKPSYVDIDVWLGKATAGPATAPTPGDAPETGIERFLSAFGPATLGDLMQWSGQRRIGLVRAAVRAMSDRAAGSAACLRADLPYQQAVLLGFARPMCAPGRC